MLLPLVLLSPMLPLGLALVACQPAADPEASEALMAKLDSNEQRLSAIEAKLDAVGTKLDQTVQSLAPLVEEAERERAREAEREARRAERVAERDARLAETRARLQALGVDGEDLDDAGLDADAPVPSDRTIEGAAEGIQCEAPSGDRWECTIDRAFLEHLLATPALLSKQARIVPGQRDGRIVGYKLYGIRPDSLPKRLGFKNGDMLVAINGIELDSMEKAMNMYIKLRRATSLEIELERKGVPMTLDVDVVK
ncbi:hypothetical protein [Paraliomyxa miuraensis]|uniref:hypothetical protein n=1 Tax=Paraliomyxa miuraensis TaxID=376150 RepID=UPI00225813E3|nr:hypothetical protein [Paraliomyxa miuraensis]MCX4245137.1 hypothetical protein [Paraliomyxa miuraensis]